MKTAQYTEKQYVSIGEAATLLHVSIDTIRRWERTGKIHASRSVGGMRRFSLAEIARLVPNTTQQDGLLPITQAAAYLGVSPTTLRRWDRTGVLKPARTLGNERVYEEQALHTVLATSQRATQQSTFAAPTTLRNKASELSDTVASGLLSVNTLTQVVSRSIAVILFAVVAILGATVMIKEMPANAAPTIGTQLPASASTEPLTGSPVTENVVTYAGITAPAVSSQTILPVSANSKITLQTNSQSDQLASLNQRVAFVSGTVTMQANNKAIFVPQAQVTPASKIFLSITNLTVPAGYTIDKKPGAGFVVTFQKPVTTPVAIDWLVLP